MIEQILSADENPGFLRESLDKTYFLSRWSTRRAFG